MSRKLFGHGRFHRAVRASSGTAYVPPEYEDYPGQPTIPQNVRQTAAAEGSMSIAWDARGDLVEVIGYIVYIDIGGVKVAQNQEGLVEDLSFTITTVYDAFGGSLGTADGAYDIYVTAYNRAGNEWDYSDVLEASTFVDTVAPSAPTINDPADDVTESTITLSWDASTDDVGVTGYYLNRTIGAARNRYVDVGDNLSYQITGLIPETEYKFDVTAYDAQGMNLMHPDIVTTTTDSTADVTAPTVGGITSIDVISSSELDINYGATTDAGSGVDQVILERADNGIDFYIQYSIAASGTYSDAGINANFYEILPN